jgi:hypothetical protein
MPVLEHVRALVAELRQYASDNFESDEPYMRGCVRGANVAATKPEAAAGLDERALQRLVDEEAKRNG